MVSECFHVLKTWLEVSRVKLYRNNLEGNKNYWFKLSRARVTKGKITVNILRKSWGKHGHCKEEQPFELRGFVQNLKRTSWPNCHFPTIDDLLDGLSPFKIIIWKTPRMPIFYREFSSAFCRALCHYYIFYSLSTVDLWVIVSFKKFDFYFVLGLGDLFTINLCPMLCFSINLLALPLCIGTCSG